MNNGEKMMPREKLLAEGPESLSKAELLAILLRTGTVGKNVIEVAEDMLRAYDNNLVTMSQASVDELSSQVSGLGKVKSIEILAALELGRRRIVEKTNRTKICNSTDAYECFQGVLADLSHEEIWILILDGQNNVTTRTRLSIGGWSETPCDIRMMLSIILKRNGAAFIMGHNHPAGTNRPSQMDIELTKKVKAAADIIGIKLRDHIIVARGNGFYSFHDNDLI